MTSYLGEWVDDQRPIAIGVRGPICNEFRRVHRSHWGRACCRLSVDSDISVGIADNATSRGVTAYEYRVTLRRYQRSVSPD